jgi:regulator of protease activity HflC (stomatin/prohibitin superfamily)
MGFGALLVFFLSIFAALGFRQVEPNERLAVYRLGRYVGLRPSGANWIVPFVDRTIRVNLDLSVPGWKELESIALVTEVETWLSQQVHS